MDSALRPRAFRLRRHRRIGWWGTAVIAASALSAPAPPAAAQLVIRGGVTSSVYTDADITLIPKERREAATVGVSIAIPVRKWVEITPELAWVNRGARRAITQTGVTVEEWFDMGYLDVGVLVRASIGSTKALRLYGAVGPVLAFLGSCSVRAEVFSARKDRMRLARDCEAPLDRNIHDPVDDVDLGFTLAAGFDLALPLLPGFLNIEGRFVRGFQSAFEDSGSPKNTLYAVTLGYGFDIW